MCMRKHLAAGRSAFIRPSWPEIVGAGWPIFFSFFSFLSSSVLVVDNCRLWHYSCSFFFAISSVMAPDLLSYFGGFVCVSSPMLSSVIILPCRDQDNRMSAAPAGWLIYFRVKAFLRGGCIAVCSLPVFLLFLYFLYYYVNCWLVLASASAEAVWFWV